MTSAQEFNCIFCKESFENKEDLQFHFRKHGDPKFNHDNKNRLLNEPQPPGEKNTEDIEMVNCDVCSEVFPTISKAITHKHKVHPDHDAKYFCPWCGKLFTMKHLYNKHMQTVHDSNEEGEKRGFHCDYCEVDFFVPSAMVYHNKFFHRQDTELAAIGQSKKLKLFNQEPLQLYYCPFCGEEYFNKVNLHKHMGDDHNDENQSPDDVLRCPLCDAIFYHLDAYELHLTFHSSDDIYCEDNEIVKEITEYSLEAVPPLMEKVESDHQEIPEATITSIGIENFLQQAMDESVDNENSNGECFADKKSKKRKKHKKSKKSAITLDEFLNMNKDVFGEGIDFQGIEEVPTQVVTKHLKSKQKPRLAPKVAQSSELEKLKNLGIAVKMKTGRGFSKFQGMKVAKGKPKGNPVNIKLPNKANVGPTTPIAMSASSDVLSKLLNQSNNQLKIIKKPQDVLDQKDLQESTRKTITSSFENEESNAIDRNETVINMEKKSEGITTPTKNDTMKEQYKVNNYNINTNVTTVKDENIQENNITNLKLNTYINAAEHSTLSKKNSTENVENNENIDKDYTEFPLGGSKSYNSATNIEKLNNSSNNVEKNNTSHNTLHALKNISQCITIKSVSSPNRAQKSSFADGESVNDNDICSNKIDKFSDTKINTEENSSNKKSLNAIKHLSHLITVKPVNQSQIRAPSSISNDKFVADNETEFDENQLENEKYDMKENTEKNTEESIATKVLLKELATPVNEKYHKEPPLDQKPMDALKNLSKQITIKSLNQSSTTKTNVNKGKDNEEGEYHRDDNLSENEEASENTPQNIFKTPKPLAKPVSTQSKFLDKKSQSDSHLPNVPYRINPCKQTKNICEDFNSTNDTITKKQSCDILKKLTNVTAKPLIKSTFQQVSVKSSTQSLNTIKGDFGQKSSLKKEESKEIEIYNIDDSDDEEVATQSGSNETILNANKFVQKENVVKSVDALRNLSKHITIKSTNQPKLQTRKELQDSEGMSVQGNADSDITDIDIGRAELKAKSSKPDNQKSTVLQNTLKNLSKQITVKSQNSSTNITKTHFKDNLPLEDFDSDSNSSTKKVQITDVSDDHNSDEDLRPTYREQSPVNVVVQLPQESNSEHDDFEEEFDIESKIKASLITPPKIFQSNKSTDINNLRNITIKSLKEHTTEDETESSLQDEQLAIPGLGSDLCIKPLRNNIPIRQGHQIATNKNIKVASERTMNQSNINKIKSATAGQMNTVNKEVTVKTFQTKTVIQEITTTVTKTIRTLNQTVQQEVRNVNQTSSIPTMRPQQIQGVRPSHQIRNYQGVAVRHAAPTVGPHIRNTAIAVRPPIGNMVRPANKIVPVRPGVNIRSNNPRMSNINKLTPSGSPQQPVIGKQLKMSPTAVISPTKRPNTEDSSGPFSCFKKQKESLIPVSDVPSFNSNQEGESSVHYASSSQINKTNITSCTRTAKGNSVVTSTHMKSEISARSQQLSRLNNMSGLKVVKTSQAKQATLMEEKSEISAPKRTTLDAIERLQKQGLLVKKPRFDKTLRENSNSDDDCDT